jgi:hypothetical protein
MTLCTNTQRPLPGTRAAREATNPPIATSLALPTSTAMRLRFLTQQIYNLGPRPLFELLAELVGGAPPLERIERYGRLAHEYGAFIRAPGGDQFPPRFFTLAGDGSK